MKLVFYELKKVLNKKVFYLFVVLCLLINGFLFFSVQDPEGKYTRFQYPDEYSEMLSEYSALPIEDAKVKIEGDMVAYNATADFKMLSMTDDKAIIKSFTAKLNALKESNPEAYEKGYDIFKRENGDLHSMWFINHIKEQLDYIESYPQFISDMSLRAAEQSKMSGFSDENSFSYKNLYKTASDYKHLNDIKLSLVNAEPVTSATDYKVTDVFIVAVIFLVCIYLFSFERERSLYTIVRCTKNGRLKTITAKLSALFIIAGSVGIFFAAENYLMGYLAYGATDLNACIQSVPEFRNCVFTVNILQFEILCICCKAMGALFTAALLAIVFVVFSSPVLSYSIGAGVFIAEYVLYSALDTRTSISLLKHLNLFYIFDGESFIGKYLNLNIFSNAVTAGSFVLCVFSALFVVEVLVACVRFCRQIQERKTSVLSIAVERIKASVNRINGSVSILSGEVFKLLIQNKMAILFLLLIIYSIYSSIGIVRYPYLEDSDYNYHDYMVYLEGDITDEKEQFIQNELKYIKSVEKKIEEIYSDSSLTSSQQESAARSLEAEINSKSIALDKVMKQYERLKELRSQGVEARFVDENNYELFVFSSKREWNNYVLFALFTVILLPCIFTVEYKNKIINLIRPTKKGKIRLFLSKVFVSYISVLIIFTAIVLPYLIRFIRTFGTNSFTTKLVCLYDYLPTDVPLNIIGAFLLNILCYFALLTAITGITVLISVVVKNNLYVMIFCSVTVLAVYLALYGIDNLRVGWLVIHFSTTELGWLFAVCAVVTAATLSLSAIRFSNISLRRGRNAA